MAADAAVEELSLCGLLSRLELIERYRGISKPTEDEEAVIGSEGAVKKRVGETLGELATAGLTSAERKGAVDFLQRQLKNVEPGTKAADARKAKLEELLSGIKAAASVEEPDHVKRAKKEVARAEKEFEAVHKEYALWEKGKKMLGVDELNKLKRTHEDGNKLLTAARALVQEQLCRRPEAAAALPSVLTGSRPSAAGALGGGGGRAKASASAVRGGGPACRKAPGAPSASTGGYPAGPSAAALRQAHLVADVRAETAWPGPVQSEPRPRPQPRPQPREMEAERPKVVLSYSCTCAAVAELLRISKDKAADLAESSQEFRAHLTEEQWEQVQQRSVEIEKQQRDAQREKEKRKQEKALAKLSGAAPSVPAASPFPSAAPPVAAKAKARPKAKAPASAPQKKKGLGGLATGNNFAGLGGDSDSDSGDEWTTVG